MDADLQLVLAHYRMMFPDRDSLGGGSRPLHWQTEYDRIAACGLSATLITGTTFDTGSASGQRNFPQTTVLRGLLIRRAELDPSFDDTAFNPPQIKPRGRLGITVRLSAGPGSYGSNGNF